MQKKNMMKMALAAFSVATSLMTNTTKAEVSEVCYNLLYGRAVNLLVANAPGGGYDLYARAIAPVLEEQSGLNVRVVNNAAGGGSVARRLMLSGGEDRLTLLMENAADLSVEVLDNGSNLTILGSVDTLGILHVDNDAWILDQKFNILDPNVSRLTSSAGTLGDALVSHILVGMALGIKVEVVAGYSGSSEFVSSVLRGEVDFTVNSLQTALRRTEGNEAYVALIASDRPNSSAPDVLYLAGDGGVVQARAVNLLDVEREQRQHFAELAVSLSGAVRGIFIPNTVSDSTRNCLREVIAESLISENFELVLADHDRPLDPLTGDAATDCVQQMIEAQFEAAPFLARLLKEQEGN